MSRAALLRLLIPGMGALALAACSSGPMGGGGPSWNAVGPSGTAAEVRGGQETRAACRERAEQMYDQRDRHRIYTANPQTNTPSSANYLSDVPSRGLSAQFEYERTVNDCVRNSTYGGEPSLSGPPVITPTGPKPR